MTEERSYKVAAHELCADILSQAHLARFLSARNCAEASRKALRVVNAINLIFPNEKMSLRDGLADPTAQTHFAESPYSLLHDACPLEDRFLGFARVLEVIGAAK